MMKVHAFVRENITKVLAYKKGNSYFALSTRCCKLFIKQNLIMPVKDYDRT